MTTPIARLTAFRDHIIATDNSLNAYRFEQLCGLANGYFKSHASYNNERGISSESIAKVKRAFPQLNVEWVLLGTGNMLTTPTGTPLYTIPFATIPLTIEGIPSPDLTPAAYLNITTQLSSIAPAESRNPSFACLASDQAMLPTIPPGSIVILTPMTVTAIATAHLGRPFAAILSDGSRITRHLAASTSRTLTFTPASTTPAYAPLKINTKTVTHLYAVTASIQMFAPYHP